MNATIQSALARIEHTQPDTVVRDATEIAIGQVIHQGDIYLHRVPDNHPRGAPLGTRKLAIGQGEGSRHMAEGETVEVFAGAKLPAWVTEPEWIMPGQLLGPVVVAHGEWLNTHPVHAHHRCPSGTFQITFQADSITFRRVVD